VSAPPLTLPVSSHSPDLANAGVDTIVAYAFFTIPPTLLGFSYDSSRQSKGWFSIVYRWNLSRPFRTHPLPAGRLRSPTTADSRLVLLLSITIHSIHHPLCHSSYAPLRPRRSDHSLSSFLSVSQSGRGSQQWLCANPSESTGLCYNLITRTIHHL
jgi:hypothetical protein